MNEFKYSQDIVEATKLAREWFIVHGCRWASMKTPTNKPKKYRIPTENEIQMEYLEMLRVANKNKSPFCESGELRVELVPLRFGYKASQP